MDSCPLSPQAASLCRGFSRRLWICGNAANERPQSSRNSHCRQTWETQMPGSQLNEECVDHVNNPKHRVPSVHAAVSVHCWSPSCGRCPICQSRTLGHARGSNASTSWRPPFHGPYQRKAKSCVDRRGKPVPPASGVHMYASGHYNVNPFPQDFGKK